MNQLRGRSAVKSSVEDTETICRIYSTEMYIGNQSDINVLVVRLTSVTGPCNDERRGNAIIYVHNSMVSTSWARQTRLIVHHWRWRAARSNNHTHADRQTERDTLIAMIAVYIRRWWCYWTSSSCRCQCHCQTVSPPTEPVIHDYHIRSSVIIIARALTANSTQLHLWTRAVLLPQADRPITYPISITERQASANHPDARLRLFY